MTNPAIPVPSSFVMMVGKTTVLIARMFLGAQCGITALLISLRRLHLFLSVIMIYSSSTIVLNLLQALLPEILTRTSQRKTLRRRHLRVRRLHLRQHCRLVHLRLHHRLVHPRPYLRQVHLRLHYRLVRPGPHLRPAHLRLHRRLARL
jgi:hypothetical protein